MVLLIEIHFYENHFYVQRFSLLYGIRFLSLSPFFVFCIQSSSVKSSVNGKMFLGIWWKPCRDECGFFTFPVAFKIISMKFLNQKLTRRWAQILMKIFQCLQFVKMWRQRNNCSSFISNKEYKKKIQMDKQIPQTLE